MDAEKAIEGEPVGTGGINPPDTIEKADALVTRTRFLGMPLDIVQKQDLPVVIGNLLGRGGAKHIVLLSVWDLLRTRTNAEYRSYVRQADLVIPISKCLISGSRFLTGAEPVRYMPFDFIIALLSTLEVREYSLYLLGGRKKTLDKAERNVKETFPNLEIVGRCAGGFKKNYEPALLESIRKASPALFMVGKGVRGEELWIPRKCGSLWQGIRFWCSDIYSVFANEKRHPSDFAFKHGVEWAGYCVRNPLYIFRFFPYVYYKILVVIWKLFKKG
jgi:N-acetylglucosaminyldiphosphoundecaprenol N-acetyl-beta-D-mannosaminyltransferase